jgi:hypothetical protein
MAGVIVPITMVGVIVPITMVGVIVTMVGVIVPITMVGVPTTTSNLIRITATDIGQSTKGPPKGKRPRTRHNVPPVGKN